MTDVPMIVLLPYQQRWIDDPAPVKVAEKSRRIGLTWGEACDDVLIAGRSTGGSDIWYIGYNQDMAREYIETCGNWARALGAAASEMQEELMEDEARDILSFRIRFASGHKITALSSRPSNLRGKQGVVVIDEAAFHDDLDQLLKAAFALLIWGGRVRVISTHDGDANLFNGLVTDIRAGRKPYSLHRIDFNQALADGLYRRITAVAGEEWSAEKETAWRASIIAFYGDGADEELFVIPSQGSGVFLGSALIEARMDAAIPVIRWEQPSSFAELADPTREAEARDFCERALAPRLRNLDPKLRSFFGQDFGRSGDLSVILPLQMGQDLVRRAPFLVELRNIPFRQQEQILFHIVDRLPRFMAGALDAGGNGSYQAERAMQRYGAGRIAQVKLSAEWYREWMPPYKAAFEDAMIVLPRDADVLADHRAIVMERGVAKVPDGARARGADGGRRHGDSAIAGALAWFASRMDGVSMEFQALGEPRVAARIGGDYLGGGGRAGHPAASVWADYLGG